MVTYTLYDGIWALIKTLVEGLEVYICVFHIVLILGQSDTKRLLIKLVKSF